LGKKALRKKASKEGKGGVREAFPKEKQCAGVPKVFGWLRVQRRNECRTRLRNHVEPSELKNERG